MRYIRSPDSINLLFFSKLFIISIVLVSIDIYVSALYGPRCCYLQQKGSTSTLGAGATPSSEAENYLTTTTTPIHPNSFRVSKSSNGQPGAQVTSASASAAPIAPQQPDPNPVSPLASIDSTDGDLSFGSWDTNDVLEHFEFLPPGYSMDDGTGDDEWTKKEVTNDKPTDEEGTDDK